MINQIKLPTKKTSNLKKIFQILDIIDQRLSIIELMLDIKINPEMFEDDDVKFKKVVKSLKGLNEISVSYIQRTQSIGYARAARFLDELETKGLVSSAQGSKPRKVLKK